MSNFTFLDDLPLLDLYEELQQMLADGTVQWFNEVQDQICINSTKHDPDNYFLGRCSLNLDWDKWEMRDGKMHVPKRETPLKETDFTELCSAFKGTGFETVYNELTKLYRVGRVRIMNSKPKTCLTWHTDSTARIHYPMKTQEGCFMIIEDEIKHLEKHNWYYTNTTVKHTAMNASTENRMHLVATVIGD